MMANYLAGRYFLRFRWSAQARMQLSPQTVGLLKSITNQVKVVVYYKKSQELYPSITALLNEYQLAKPNIKIETVDYEVDAAAAQTIKSRYNLTSTDDKDLVIFESGTRVHIVPGKLLGDYALEQVPNEKEREWHQKLKAFKGEQLFDSALLTISSAKTLKACFLAGHAEHDPAAQHELGYSKFTTLLAQSCVQPERLQLLGTNGVPADCNLLIIAGPLQRFQETEREKIKQYLAQGGRALILFNAGTKTFFTGLEQILAEWGVDVGLNQIKDPKNATFSTAMDVLVSRFNRDHPIVNPIQGGRLQMLQPRSIARLAGLKEGAGAPKVDELAASSENSFIDDSPVPTGRPVPLMAAVERGAGKGVYADRGATRMVIVGDSCMLDNQLIEQESNYQFAGSAINWLLDRAEMMQGVGPRPVVAYRFIVTRAQMQNIELLFLAGMPGSILLLGGLIWLRRRH
jgi:hypothetical protein